MHVYRRILFVVMMLPVTCRADSFIMHHILDDYKWHIFSTDKYDVTIYLPIITISRQGLNIFSSKRISNNATYNGFKINTDGKLENIDKNLKFIDLSITKNIFAMMISLLILIIILLSCALWYRKNPNKAPGGIIGLIEIFIIYMIDNAIKPNIGKKYKSFAPYLLTIFFYIWFNNMLGLLPGWANVTGNITITACLAFMTFVVTNINGTKHYWHEVFCPEVPKFLYPIMVPIESIELLTKPITLMIRLFANITSGHIVLLSIINLAFIFNSYALGIAGVFINTFMTLLKLLVSFMQAYIFVLLSSIYIGNAVRE